MEDLPETLLERVDQLIEAHKHHDLLSTTGPHAAAVELAARLEGLEEALREIAAEVHRLSRSTKA